MWAGHEPRTGTRIRNCDGGRRTGAGELRLSQRTGDGQWIPCCSPAQNQGRAAESTYTSPASPLAGWLGSPPGGSWMWASKPEATTPRPAVDVAVDPGCTSGSRDPRRPACPHSGRASECCDAGSSACAHPDRASVRIDAHTPACAQSGAGASGYVDSDSFTRGEVATPAAPGVRAPDADAEPARPVVLSPNGAGECAR